MRRSNRFDRQIPVQRLQFFADPLKLFPSVAVGRLRFRCVLGIFPEMPVLRVQRFLFLFELGNLCPDLKKLMA